jgi:hypothetical protein
MSFWLSNLSEKNHFDTTVEAAAHILKIKNRASVLGYLPRKQLGKRAMAILQIPQSWFKDNAPNLRLA